jgi:hypothetical protein
MGDSDGRIADGPAQGRRRIKRQQRISIYTCRLSHLVRSNQPIPRKDRRLQVQIVTMQSGLYGGFLHFPSIHRAGENRTLDLPGSLAGRSKRTHSAFNVRSTMIAGRRTNNPLLSITERSILMEPATVCPFVPPSDGRRFLSRKRTARPF